MSELLDDLPIAHLEYGLRDGVVGDWLVLGPLMAPLADPVVVQSNVSRQLALNALIVDADEIIHPPAERATSTVTVAEGITLQEMWRLVNTLEDGWVDLAAHVEMPHMLCAWVYAQIVLPERLTTQLKLTTASQCQVWINGDAIFGYSEIPDSPTRLSFEATLDEGSNEILVRVANVGQGDVPMMVALEIPGAEGKVTLPTVLEPVARRQKLATVMGYAYLAQDIYSRDQRVILRWPTDMQVVDALTMRLQTPDGRIYGEANRIVQKGTKVDFGEASQFPDGTYEVLLQPQFEEYYVENMRVQRRIPLQIRNGKWSLIYYGTYAERRQEALEDAARRRGGIYCEIAKSALGQWEKLNHELIEEAITQLPQRGVTFEETLLALLGWVARMGDLPDFPQEFAWSLAESVPLLLERLESQASLQLAACHLLAGQLYEDRTFADLNTGEWHQQQAEAWLLRWLHITAQQGMPGGESEQSYGRALVVLSHLVDLARSDEIAELAAVVLDKLAYQVALQCFVGAWGGSQEQSNSLWLRSARLGALAGVNRLWWGQGAYNVECAATVALACAENYMLPEIIAAVGLDRQQENWLRRRDLDTGADAPRQINRAAFRTGDYLLASAQGDWPAGSAGPLWQVTMGPDALIFGNRPYCSSIANAWGMNYWRGNAAPVRVAQWQDVLLVAYREGGDAFLAYSHAYFPQAAFDEVHVGDGWVMAAKDNGYVALTATGGVELVPSGNTAQREVRAAPEAIWLVQMGRAAQDGSFTEFVAKVLAQPLTLTQDQAHYQTLRGQQVRFSANAPLENALLMDDSPQPLTDFPHIESIYGGADTLPATSVEICYQEHIMRLDFGAAEMNSA